jgi:murein DD-endopeptidase MepM/ murein hydrolase activator NlpD
MSRKAWIFVIALVLSPVLLVVLVGGFTLVSIGGAIGAGGDCTAGIIDAQPTSAAGKISGDSSTSAAGGLTVKTTTGSSLTLDSTQLSNASTIMGVGNSLGVSSNGLTVALIVALQESKLQNYANSTVPESLQYPHEAVGSDHDSVNPFQQRANWGSLADRMNVTYAAKAFFGGPGGPNHGTPAGLLDTPSWQLMTAGGAAQSVQVSAFPDAYNKWIPAAQMILANAGGGTVSGGCTISAGNDGTAVLPLPIGYTMSSNFGPRVVPIEGASSWHPADDLADACGTPVYASLPGIVTLSSELYLSIKNPDGFVISYLHMYKTQRLVNVGDTVTIGQQIGVVGKVPPATGCHLDFRVNVTANTNPAVAKLTQGSGAPGFVNPEDFMKVFGVDLCPPATCARNY